MDTLYKTIKKFDIDRKNQEIQLIAELGELKKLITKEIDRHIEEVKIDVVDQGSYQEKIIKLILDSENFVSQELSDFINGLIREEDDLSFLNENSLIEYFVTVRRQKSRRGLALKNELEAILDQFKLDIVQEKKLKIGSRYELQNTQHEKAYTDLELSFRNQQLPYVVDNLKQLQNFKGLRRLIIDLYNNDISDISFIKEISDLNQLKVLQIELSQNIVMDITPIKYLIKLKNLRKLVLGLNFNCIIDLNPLISLPNELETLNIEFEENPIEDINSLQVLSGMLKLRNLSISLSNTKITSIKALEVLQNLRELRVLGLGLFKTNVKNIDLLYTLQSCKQLKFFQISVCETNVKSFDFLFNLKNLEELEYIVVETNKQVQEQILKNTSELLPKKVQLVGDHAKLMESGKKLWKDQFTL